MLEAWFFMFTQYIIYIIPLECPLYFKISFKMVFISVIFSANACIAAI